ncbi:hypothetical protein HD554DRAFT_2038283 [Boletus coccyginus]|nr:hypothetical protein HD554DRAFT_2038283 [Boletus coccyginus]
MISAMLVFSRLEPVQVQCDQALTRTTAAIESMNCTWRSLSWASPSWQRKAVSKLLHHDGQSQDWFIVQGRSQNGHQPCGSRCQGASPSRSTGLSTVWGSIAPFAHKGSMQVRIEAHSLRQFGDKYYRPPRRAEAETEFTLWEPGPIREFEIPALSDRPGLSGSVQWCLESASVTQSHIMSPLGALLRHLQSQPWELARDGPV